MSNRQAAGFYRDHFKKIFGIDKESRERLFMVAGEPVIVSERFIVGKGGRVKITKGSREQYVPLFHRTITDPDEIWLTPMQSDSGQVILRRRHLAFWRDERDMDTMAGFSVLDIDRGVATGVTVYNVAGKEQNKDGLVMLDNPKDGYRRGVLLYRKNK